jgi:hypothetical protein
LESPRNKAEHFYGRHQKFLSLTIVTMQTRRRFLMMAASVPACAAAVSGPALRCDSGRLQRAYDAAIRELRKNTIRVNEYPDAVLIEGGNYGGVWLECAPLEGLVWSPFRPRAGRANHDIFFAMQRDDGYLPCNVRLASIGTGQIQMAVPIAATAYELFQTLQDEAFLTRAYEASTRWDDWLMRFRNTRGTGLCEGFCEYDTGHDNSPRWHGIPKSCPGQDARVCPKVEGLPYLSPDLSATVYGGRVALAGMARALGKPGEADRWEQRAATIQKAILERLYDPQDACFYDVDSRGRYVRVRGDALTRVLGEHVVDERLFGHIYSRQIRNPRAFWAKYPLPSIALDDPAFVRPLQPNSWGGPSQALTALRAPRWLEHYRKPADLAYLMSRWVEAIVRSGSFLQQLNPDTGEFTPDGGGYSPAALVLLDFVWRLYGVRRKGGELEWNCRLPEGASSCTSEVGAAVLKTAAGGSELLVSGRRVLEVAGTVRVITDARGKALRLVGTQSTPVQVTLKWCEGKTRTYALTPDAVVKV